MATNDQAAAAQSPAETGEYTHAQILTILTGLLLGMFLGALDQTIVSTSIRTVADDLDGLSIQAWVTTAYLITSTITTPIYGKLGDLYGRKKLFMFAISVFIVGSVLCAFATSMYELAAFRAFQGIGAGGLFTLVLAIIGDIVSPRERAKYTGYFMATFATSSVLGPVIGGFFAGQDEILGVTGWRWVFLVNVPVGIVALVVVFRTLHLRHQPRQVRIDWWGAVALVVALVPLLTVAEQGREWGWDSARSITAYVVGGLGLAAFYFAERAMGDAALIPLRLFRIRAAAITILADVRDRRRDVRRHPDPAAVHADRARRLTDHGRAADAADGARHDVRCHGLGQHHRPDRSHPSSRGSVRRSWWLACYCSRPPPPTRRSWSSTSSCSYSAWGSATACSRCS